MSNLDIPNKEDEELLKLAGEFKEYMLSRNTSFPDISGKDIWDKLYYAGMLPGILRFFMARENPLKEDLKVVDKEDESMLRKSPEDEEFRKMLQSMKVSNLTSDKGTAYFRLSDGDIDNLMQLIKSRDQRIALEAREQGVIDFCKDIKHKVDLLFISHPPETIVLPWEQTVRPIIYKYAATQSQKEEQV